MTLVNTTFLRLSFMITCLHVMPMHTAAARRTIFDRYRPVTPNLTYGYVTRYGNTPALRPGHNLFLTISDHLVARRPQYYRPALQSIMEVWM